MTRLSLIVPCYNEAARLPGTLAALLGHLPADPDTVEVLVVDDGSTDHTADLAGTAAATDPRVRVLAYHPNRGKGFAVRTGVLAATGELIAFTDADGAFEPDQLDRLVAAIAHTPAAMAIGIRQPGPPPAAPGPAGEPLTRRLTSPGFNLATRAVLGLRYRDTQCGLKAWRRHVARELFHHARIDGFAFDAELLVLADHMGIAVAEVPVRATPQPGSTVRPVHDAARMLADLWRIRRYAAAGFYDRRPGDGAPHRHWSTTSSSS